MLLFHILFIQQKRVYAAIICMETFDCSNVNNANDEEVWINHILIINTGLKARMALMGHANAKRHVLLNTRKLPVYSTCRLCQHTQTLNLLVVVRSNAHGLYSRWEWDGGRFFSALKPEPLPRGVNPNRKS
jgi:hypothetical protein